MKTIVYPINVLDGPLDVWDEVRRNAIGEEPVHLCDLSDVVRKYINWIHLLPRVVPFYGWFHIITKRCDFVCVFNGILF